MKKRLVLALILLTLILLISCNTHPADTPAESSEEVPAYLSLGTEYSVPGYADFAMVRLEAAPFLLTSMGHKFGQTPRTDELYIDLVLDFTNLTQKHIYSGRAVSFTATGSKGIYENALFLLESEDMTLLTINERLEPQSTARLHCGLAIPVGEEFLQLELNVNGQLFTLELAPPAPLKNAAPFALGDEIINENLGSLVLQELRFTVSLASEGNESIFTLYTPPNTKNHYFVASLQAANSQDVPVNIHRFLGCALRSDNGRLYTGFAVEENQSGFEPFGQIESNEAVTLHLLVEVPKEEVGEGESWEFSLFFDGAEYLYSGKIVEGE